MKGFAERAIIIMPKPETYNSRVQAYQLIVAKTIENITGYLADHDITSYYLNSDELAVKLQQSNLPFINTASAVDKLFIRKYCEGFDNMPDGLDLYDAYIREVMTSIPNVRGLEIEEHFKLVVKRQKKVVNKILSDEKIIVDLSLPTNPTFKVPPSQEGDSRMVITTNHTTNQIATYIGGMHIEPEMILGFTGATRPIHLWQRGDWL